VTSEDHRHTQEVAGGRLASSAQPLRAPSFFSPDVSSPQPPQPSRSILLVDTPGALRESLRCFTASRPLPRNEQAFGKTSQPFLY
jgi:hypothetical protein